MSILNVGRRPTGKHGAWQFNIHGTMFHGIKIFKANFQLKIDYARR